MNTDNIVKMYTDSMEIEVDINNVSDLIYAMRFKANNIKAHTDPKLFIAVADALMSLIQDEDDFK